MNNGVGRTPLSDLDGYVALGTDGIGSDMWEEGRAGYFRRHEEDLASPGSGPLHQLTRGARLVGDAFGEPYLGRIIPGAPADLAVLDYLAPTPLVADTLAGHWVFGLSASHVRDVLVGGEFVVRNRRLARCDEEQLTALARAQARRLWARLEDIGPHPFAPAHQRATASAGTRWPT